MSKNEMNEDEMNNRELNESGTKDYNKIPDLEKSKKKLVNERVNLKNIFLREEISAEEYTQMKERIEAELVELDEQIERERQERAELKNAGNEKENLNKDKDNLAKEGFIIEGLKDESGSDLIKRQVMKVDGVKSVEFH